MRKVSVKASKRRSKSVRAHSRNVKGASDMKGSGGEMKKKYAQKSSPSSPFGLGETSADKAKKRKTKGTDRSSQPPYKAGAMTYSSASKKHAKATAPEKKAIAYAKRKKRSYGNR